MKSSLDDVADAADDEPVVFVLVDVGDDDSDFLKRHSCQHHSHQHDQKVIGVDS